MKKLTTIGIVLAMCALLAPAAWAGTGKGQHVNIISFQKDDAATAGVNYPETIKGSFADIIASMNGKAEPFLMVHTSHTHPKDMINAQVDSLGQRPDGSMEDDGLNCAFVFGQQNGAYTLGGICHVITATNRNNNSEKFVLPTEAIPDAAKGETATWKRLFVDDKSGTAFYASVER